MLCATFFLKGVVGWALKKLSSKISFSANRGYRLDRFVVPGFDRLVVFACHGSTSALHSQPLDAILIFVTASDFCIQKRRRRSWYDEFLLLISLFDSLIFGA